VSCACQLGTGGAIQTSSAGTQESWSIRSTHLVSVLRSVVFYHFREIKNKVNLLELTFFVLSYIHGTNKW
jgi:hypothetical protein